MSPVNNTKDDWIRCRPEKGSPSNWVPVTDCLSFWCCSVGFWVFFFSFLSSSFTHIISRYIFSNQQISSFHKFAPDVKIIFSSYFFYQPQQRVKVRIFTAPIPAGKQNREMLNFCISTQGLQLCGLLWLIFRNI